MAKVEELTRQLEELRGRHAGGPGAGGSGGPGGHLGAPASAELEKLRRELLVSVALGLLWSRHVRAAGGDCHRVR